TWEEFTLELLWNVCLAGVERLRSTSSKEPSPRQRHRDVLLQATGEDSDVLVNDFLIRQCAAFLDQGFSRWPMPEREHGLYRCVLSLHSQAGSAPDRWLRGWSAEARRLLEANLPPLESIEESLTLLGVASDEQEPFLTQTLLALRGWAG